MHDPEPGGVGFQVVNDPGPLEVIGLAAFDLIGVEPAAAVGGGGIMLQSE